MQKMPDFLTGVDHPAIATGNVAGLCTWYIDTLGFEKKAEVAGGAWLLGLADGTYLEIMPEDGSPRPARSVFTAGLSHLALRVKNLDTAISTLEKSGITWTNEISPAVGGGRLRNFCDPEGNILQIVER